MRILVVDDEAPARSRLKRLIGELGAPYEVIGEAADGREAVRRARELQADLVLMDIRMPGMDGLDAASELMAFEHSPAVIFTTAYDSHALEAFGRNAADYLLKPVRKERLAAALERVSSLTRPQLAALRQAQGFEGREVRVSHRGGIQQIPLQVVQAFRAEDKYVQVLHDGGEDLCDLSLKALESRFGEHLLRIHRNTLVMRNRIRGLERSGGSHRLRLHGCEGTLEISRRHLAEVRQFLRGEGPASNTETPTRSSA